jgi:cysteine synthase A
MGIAFIAVMPEGVSSERSLMIRAFGGEIRLTPAAGGIEESIRESERLGATMEAFLPRQFSNEENALAHKVGTARELIEQLPVATVDAVVSGVGTGGTLVGLCEGLREAGCRVLPVVARPVLLSGQDMECCSFSSRIPGVVECLSTIFHPGRLGEVETIEVEDRQAIEMARDLARMGFPVGPSSGLNFTAAMAVGRRLGPGSTVVTVFPDRMERYFTTEMFAPYQPRRSFS